MELIIFIGTLSLIIAVELVSGVLYIKKQNGKRNEEFEKEETMKNSLLCRFVLDGTGKKIGESVAVDGDIIIIKANSKYLGVPLKHIEEEEKTLLVKGLIDHDKAEEMGEEWRQNSFREINQMEESEKDERI